MSDRSRSLKGYVALCVDGIAAGDWGLPARETGIAPRTVDPLGPALALRGAHVLLAPDTGRVLLFCALGWLALDADQLRRLQTPDGLILGRALAWQPGRPPHGRTLGWARVSPAQGLPVPAYRFTAVWTEPDLAPLPVAATPPVRAAHRGARTVDGDGLRLLRRRLHLTQAQAAALVQLSTRAYASQERGEYGDPALTATRLEAAAQGGAR